MQRTKALTVARRSTRTAPKRSLPSAIPVDTMGRRRSSQNLACWGRGQEGFRGGIVFAKSWSRFFISSISDPLRIPSNPGMLIFSLVRILIQYLHKKHFNPASPSQGKLLWGQYQHCSSLLKYPERIFRTLLLSLSCIIQISELLLSFQCLLSHFCRIVDLDHDIQLILHVAVYFGYHFFLSELCMLVWIQSQLFYQIIKSTNYSIHIRVFRHKHTEEL